MIRFSATSLKHIVLWGILFGIVSFSSAQTVSDTLKREKTHSPRKATLLALAPGAGQIYNKKYWKLPIVYAGFGVTGYFAITNGIEYRKFNEAYVCSVNAEEPEDCDNELAQKYSESDLQTFRDYYRRNMELSYILMGVWYILQILDATVDAHLYYWEVDDNISVEWKPVIQPAAVAKPLPGFEHAYNGISIKVNF